MTTDDITRIYDKIDNLCSQMGEINERSAMMLAKMGMNETMYGKLEDKVEAINKRHAEQGWQIAITFVTAAVGFAASILVSLFKTGGK